MNVQDLIGEVAKRHNVLVDPQDPIFVAVTLNELLLAEHVQKMQASLERAEKATALASSRHLDVARRTAADLMADSSRHVSDQMRAAGSALRTQLQYLVQQVVEALLFFNPAVWWISRRARSIVSPGTSLCFYRSASRREAGTCRMRRCPQDCR